MKRVFKYAVPVAGYYTIAKMPHNAEILTVQMQRGEPFVWAMVDDEDAPKYQRIFRWLGTGHPADDAGKYVGTIQLDGGALIFHLFDGGEK